MAFEGAEPTWLSVMRSRHPHTSSELFGKWLIRATVGLFLFLVSFCVLWASGFLDHSAGLIVSALASSDSLEVRVVSLRSNLFWSTTVDTVLVRTAGGVTVLVTGARVDGSLADFVTRRHLRGVYADGVIVDVQTVADTTEETTLPEVLGSVQYGIVTAADTLLVTGGYVRVGEDLIVDSMYLATRVGLENGAELMIDSASAVVTGGTGLLSARGHLRLDNCVLASRMLTARHRSGSLSVEGVLDGCSGQLRATLTGEAGLDWLDPVTSGSVLLEADVSGYVDSPVAMASLSTRDLEILGTALELRMDSLLLSPDSVEVISGELASGNLSGSFRGRFDPSSTDWFVVTSLGLRSFTPSDIIRGESPGIELSGSIDGYIEGNIGGPGWLSVEADLESVLLEGVDLGSVDLSGSTDLASWRMETGVTSSGCRLVYSGSGTLTRDLGIATHEGSLLLDCSRLHPVLTRLPGLERLGEASGLAADLEISGTARSISLSGGASVGRMTWDGLEVEGLSFTGGLSVLPSGAAGGLSVDGRCLASRIGIEDVAAEQITVEGNLRTGGPVAEGHASVEIGNLVAGTAGLQARTTLDYSGSDVLITDLSLVTSGGISASAAGLLRLEDGDQYLRMTDIEVGLSKLRLISDGLLSASKVDDTIRIDTLRVETPHGEATLSLLASSPGDTMDLGLVLENVDLASLSSALGIHGGFSGVGCLELSVSRRGESIACSCNGHIGSPAFMSYSADSITLAARMDSDTLSIDGVYSWDGGQRTGLNAVLDSPWTGSGIEPSPEDLISLELQVEEELDWILGLLPIDLRTRGGHLSAHLDYSRGGPGGPSASSEIIATAEEVYLTSLGLILPGVQLRVVHSDPAESTYTTQITLSAVDFQGGNLEARAELAFSRYLPTPAVGRYSLHGRAEAIYIGIPGIAAMSVDGKFTSSGDSLSGRPELIGSIDVLDGLVAVPSMQEGGGSEPELPLDLNLQIIAERGLWLRSTFADIELGADLRMVTSNRRPVLTGTIEALRGRAYLLQKEFQIVEGTLQFYGYYPARPYLSALCETHIVGSIDRESYTIQALIQGYIDNLEMTLSGTGPAGELLEEDVLTLLALGITYGQLQQLDSGALEAELESIAQSYLGQLISRNIREGVGLDHLQVSPELVGEEGSRSLVVNLGKYVLQDLYVSFEDDVLSSDPGTIRAQYFLTRDFSIVGSTRSSLHGEMEPSLELHYIFRY